MSLKMWLVLILGFVNKSLQSRAEDEKKTCAAHEKWTVFQRRKYGNVDFFRGWDDYVNGFGDCEGDLWLGLESLHQLTKEDDMSLEINMVWKYWKKVHVVARFSSFSIGPGTDKYRLHVSGFSGNATVDCLTYNNNRQFSTKDADRDGSSGNCASKHEGGWWYRKCANSNLNGNFNKTGSKGIWWYSRDIHLRYSEMKVYRRCVAREESTVFQRRKYGNVDFYRGWNDYVNGFGNCDGDFWLGLGALHQATKENDMLLEISMMSKDKKEHSWARYSNFSIGPGSENYTLHVSGYSGNATYDGLSYHNNLQFSTKDADHDGSSEDCASVYEGGWWYGNCSDSNLNGNFNITDRKGIWWRGNVPDQDLHSPHFLGYSEMRFYKHKRYAARDKWTVFQRRKYGNVSFDRGWNDYVNGFGDFNGDLWLGLEALHRLTKGDDMSLEINMMSKDKKDHLWAKYRYFRISPGPGKYRLYVSGFSGNAGDGFLYSNNYKFSTKDVDHDRWSSGNCASKLEGGGWYRWCANSNLNGNFNKTDRKRVWWRGNVHVLCCSEMKVYKRT